MRALIETSGFSNLFGEKFMTCAWISSVSKDIPAEETNRACVRAAASMIAFAKRLRAAALSGLSFPGLSYGSFAHEIG